jgi:peroxiredoxin
MIPINKKAPDFQSPLLGGGDYRFYDDTRLAVLAFYKYNCPTCQLTLPYLQRIYNAYGDSFNFVAIAQDDSANTVEFRKTYGITIPTLLDMKPYPVSSEYGLESVPSIFVVNPDRTIRYSGDGFMKQDLLNLADVLAEKSGREQLDVFGNDDVPEMKPG